MLKDRLKLLAILFSIPVLGLIVYQLVLNSYGTQWLEALLKAFPQEASEKLRTYRLEVACADSSRPEEMNSWCRDRMVVVWLQGLCWFVLALSILMPAVVYVAGRACRSNRELLLRVFKPGLRLALGTIALLVPLEALIAIGMIWFGESALINRVHMGWILALAIGGVGGAYAVMKVALTSARPVTAEVNGVAVTKEAAPGLWRNVEEWASAVGTAPPEHIIVGDDPTYFVTEAEVRHAEGECRGRTLYLSSPLSRLLSVEELRAIVFHELGHFHGADTQFSLKFYPIYRGAQDSLLGLASAAANSGNGGLALMPTLYLLSFFLNSFAEAENEISRERELAADQVAARHGGAHQAAAGLVKVVAFSWVWEKAVGTFFEYPNAKVVEVGPTRYPAEEFLAQPAAMFVNMAAEASGPELLAEIGEQRLAHPVDSHPPVAARLEAWGVTLAEIQEDALNARPAIAATTLIDNMEEIDGKLAVLLRKSLPEMVIAPPSFTMLEGE